MEGIPVYRPSREREPEDERTRAFKAALAASGASILEAADARADITLDADRFREFPPSVMKALQLNAVFAAEYLAGPIIQDPFGDSDSIDPWVRRNWRSSLIAEFGPTAEALLETNRMRANLLMPILAQSERTLERLDASGIAGRTVEEVRDSLVAILAPCQPIEDFGSRYIHAPLAERIAIVRAVSAAARSYLELVTGEGRLQEAA